jgi:hypothetical protein
MECRNHPATAAADRCAGCMEPFCPNCIVTVRGRKYCGSCKELALDGKTPVFHAVTEVSDEAKEALKYALVGFLCIGIILGLVAVNKAGKAKAMMKANPNLLGFGIATAAQILGLAAFVLSGLQILARIRARG